MAEALEAIMLICFGLSWPMNAYKNFKARTAAGTSWQLILLITLGYFAGIAVGPSFQNHGLGSLLFYKLCQAEKDCGARYMSLFTGINNHAQNIYKSAGFETKRYFAVMIKEL